MIGLFKTVGFFLINSSNSFNDIEFKSILFSLIILERVEIISSVPSKDLVKISFKSSIVKSPLRILTSVKGIFSALNHSFTLRHEEQEGDTYILTIKHLLSDTLDNY